MADYIGAEKLNKILPSLLKAEVGCRRLPRLFVKNKMASAQRIVLTRRHQDLIQAYYLVDEEGQYEKKGFEITHKVTIMSQVVIRGYFIFKCDEEKKIILYNPKTDDTMISPELPSTKKTVDYVGNCSDKFTLLSLVLCGDDEVVEEVWVLVFNAENPQWTKVDTTNLRTLKIRKPNDTCILTDDQIFFSAYLYLDNQTMDIDGQYEDIVVSFGLVFHSLKVYGLPIAMVSFCNKRLVKLQGELAVVVYNDLRTEPFEIWRRENTWNLWHTTSFGATFWEKNEKRRNEYSVSLATSNGVLVLTPITVRKTMKTGKPVYVFMYDPCKGGDVIALDISWTKLEKRSPILTAVDYEVA